ncbi:hypothetical protein CBS115989_3602 [Aspergillus niger]|nr:hypothetical protein CBS115989_3602 [Aspergillus niger]KAI2853476.1 hypothetical protein CBS11350_214 [Aspergillus niger]KAI2861250.1 hypothetical protein CBS11232_886 [Aspergillus niger]KAI2871690.1 hypothetical protein CBS115988_8371 [Aspergillus niger]KAI2883968.1 hypothetical protein CBS11852_8941 [Aspergillus niger]
MKTDVPKESKGVYDIVHVRNVVFVLSDQGIEDILSKVFGLIKPGGYTQWGEVDIHYLRIDKINEECSTSALEEIVRITRSADPRLVPHWDPELPRLFESIGLVDIKKETREGPGYMDYMLHECVLMAHDIIVRNTNNKEVGQRLHGILLLSMCDTSRLRNSLNMAPSKQSIEALGSSVSDLTASLAHQLEALNQPEPSFAIDAPASLPQSLEIQGTRLKLLETLETLHHLVIGPSDFWHYQSMFLNHSLLAFDVFNNFNFWDAVPLNGSASYADIAKSTNLPEQIVRRILRLAFTIFVFAEEAPGSDRVVHTAASALIVRNPFVKSYLEHNMEDVRPAATVGVDALKKWFVGESEPPEDVAACPIALATYDGHQSGGDLWQLLENSERPGQPKGFRAKRFAEAMQGLRMTSGVMTECVLKQFDWSSLNEATVVDLGGSAGHISVILADNYPKLDLVVQDLASAQSAFDENINSTHYASRIKFQTHNFFEPQVLPADVFLLKSVLHDWSDKYVLQIVRNLLGVLKPGNHLVIFDFVMPEDYNEETDSMTPLTVRKLVASMDMQMFVGCNSKERKVKDWNDVVKRADGRFELKEVHVPRGSPLGLLDFVFQG